MSFHTNPKTGEVRECRATMSCPFGDLQTDHYETAVEAREAYEASVEQDSDDETNLLAQHSRVTIEQNHIGYKEVPDTAERERVAVTGLVPDEDLADADAKLSSYLDSVPQRTSPTSSEDRIGEWGRTRQAYQECYDAYAADTRPITRVPRARLTLEIARRTAWIAEERLMAVERDSSTFTRRFKNRELREEHEAAQAYAETAKKKWLEEKNHGHHVGWVPGKKPWPSSL